VNRGLGQNTGGGCGTNSFYGTELTSNRRIITTWENYAWVAGADITNGCAWSREVWQGEVSCKVAQWYSLRLTFVS
jgi:hypothetical protein